MQVLTACERHVAADDTADGGEQIRFRVVESVHDHRAMDIKVKRVDFPRGPEPVEDFVFHRLVITAHDPAAGQRPEMGERHRCDVGELRI